MEFAMSKPALVRHISSVPVASDFEGSGGPPIIINTVTGIAYTLTDAGVVVTLDGQAA
jgi:hypothetical protein